MPELPEVETTLRGIKPHIIQQKVTDVIVRFPRLRWAIPPDLSQTLHGQTLKNLTRRGKYLLMTFANGTLILHLGMSGRLQILTNYIPAQKHDHVDIYFNNKKYLRFTDPRRFGALLFTSLDPNLHPLLAHMGPEPLSSEFNGDYLWKIAHGRKVPIKSFIMDSKIVAGVGNIYAIEALFKAQLHPQKPAGKISLDQFKLLADAIKAVLKNAIKKGGTTLKDFVKPSGSPGYFQIELHVYGREGKPCPRCSTTLKSAKIGQRSSVFCPKCQKK